MAEELLKKIPPEKRWAITAKYLLGLAVLQGEVIIAPEMGKDEGITAPVLGAEKWKEINYKIYGEGFLQMLLWVKETFNIPVEDAIGMANLSIVTFALAGGPGLEVEYVEKTPERVIARYPKCPYMDRYNEFEVDHEFIPCVVAHKENYEERIDKINPKLAGKLTKAMPWGDPYCENVIEFKDE
jgi:hypothetical protein